MDKLIEMLEKLIKLLGKIIKALFSSKIFWIIVVAVAIFSLAALYLYNAQGVTVLDLKLVVRAALVSIALIAAKIIIWVIGLIRDQFFA
jgi:hypothetical protein